MKSKTAKKIISAAMAVIMTVGAGVLPTAAAEKASSSASSSQSAEEKNMKAALTAVKKRITVPERLTEFRYSRNTQIGTESFDFSWNDKEYKETVNITYANGLILSYRYNDNRSAGDDKAIAEKQKQSFAKLSDEKLIEYAKKHMKQLNPDIANDVEYRVSNISLFGNTASVAVDRIENGIAVEGNGGTVTLDKNTGELIGFGLEWFWKGTKFTDPAKKLSAAKAREKYKELTTLTPVYRVIDEYDEKTKETKQKAVLLYLSDFSEELDALSGEPSTIWDDMQADKGSSTFGYFYTNGFDTTEAVAMDDADVDDAAGAAEGGVVFTEAELKEIAADESVLKKEEITALLNKVKYTKIPDYASIERANLYKDEETGEYFYSITYTGGSYDVDVVEVAEEVDADGSVTATPAKNAAPKQPYFYMHVNLNAKTGKVLNFDKNVYYENDDTKPYPVKANAKIAEAAAKYYYGDVFGEFKANESNSKPDEPYFDGNGNKKYWSSQKTYRFDRYVNGVRVENDTIRIMVNKVGEVLMISKQYSDVKFPSVPEFDRDKAFERLFKQIKLNLYYDGYYKPDGTVKTYLLYDINSYTLDSKYRVVSWDGTVLPEETDDDTAYTDIKGIAQEKAITTLARYGIVLETKDGKFNPNGTLTDKEFAAVVYLATRSYVPYYIEEGGYNGEEKPIVLTKKEAMKVFVDVYGGADFAQLKGIYRSPYSDVPTSDEYVGYIAIAKALGFASADKDGKFNPNRKITRAQAMQLIYDYIRRLN